MLASDKHHTALSLEQAFASAANWSNLACFSAACFSAACSSAARFLAANLYCSLYQACSSAAWWAELASSTANKLAWSTTGELGCAKG